MFKSIRFKYCTNYDEREFIEYDVLAEFDIYTDHHWGADIDGNRGERRDFLTLDRIYVYAGSEDVTKSLDTETLEDIKEKAQDLIILK